MPTAHASSVPDHVKTYCADPQDHALEKSLDLTVLLDGCRPALERQEPVTLNVDIRNVNRTAGTILSRLSMFWQNSM